MSRIPRRQLYHLFKYPTNFRRRNRIYQCMVDWTWQAGWRSCYQYSFRYNHSWWCYQDIQCRRIKYGLHHRWPYLSVQSNFNCVETTIIATPTQTESSSGGGGVSGGAAAGIAIGILALIGIGAGAFFFIRRRRREDYQKQYEGSHFGSSPGSLSRPFAPDQRLEPGMVQKRESVGSLADEQDYSRKILRVSPSEIIHADSR